MNNLPAAVVLTFPKTGSTSLYHTFAQHPGICLPNAKETWFFDQYWNNGIQWYKERFLHCPDNIISCDFASTLMYEEGFTEKLKQTVPEAKFIVLLRDPVARCVSHYFHEVRRGLEKEDLETALALEKGRIVKDPGRYSHIAYQDIGSLYKSRISELLEAFPREQICFILLEELVTMADNIVTLWDFIEVEPLVKELARENVARLPRNRAIDILLNMPVRLYNIVQNSSVLQHAVPKSVKYKTRKIRFQVSRFLSLIHELAYKETSKPDIPEHIYNELVEYYNEKLKALDIMTGKDLGSYWKWYRSLT